MPLFHKIQMNNDERKKISVKSNLFLANALRSERVGDIEWEWCGRNSVSKGLPKNQQSSTEKKIVHKNKENMFTTPREIHVNLFIDLGIETLFSDGTCDRSRMCTWSVCVWLISSTWRIWHWWQQLNSVWVHICTAYVSWKLRWRIGSR